MPQATVQPSHDPRRPCGPGCVRRWLAGTAALSLTLALVAPGGVPQAAARVLHPPGAALTSNAQPGKIQMQGQPPAATTLPPTRPGTPELAGQSSSPAPQMQEDRLEAPRLAGPKMEQGRFADPDLRRDVARLRRQAKPATGYGSTPAAARAAWTLGLIELHGGVAASSTQVAQTWFERAVRLDQLPIAWAGMAWCYITGCSDWPDSSRAEQAIVKLRPHYPGRALYLQWVLKSRSTPLTLGTPNAQGITSMSLPLRGLLEQAAAAGDAQARVELGINAVTNGDIPGAIAYFKAAAAHSRAAAANIKLLQSLQQKTAETPSATKSEADRLFEQAQRLHRGVGAPMNYAEALRLYREAADRGSVAAKRMLATIFSRPMPDGSVNVAWMSQLAYLDTTGVLPTVDARALGTIMYRDPTPLFDLLPARWQQALTTIPVN